MGVPKFYRWISERYPCLSTVVKEYQIPDFDNLYLDMNGIIHNCSHPNDEDPHFRITEEKIFSDIFHYIEFLFSLIKPKKVFFMAIDGVAPRAKMNQQRGRRFRSAKEAEHLENLARQRGETLPTEARFDSNCISPGTEFMARLHDMLQYFVSMKVSTDPLWQGVRVYLSGHETPGEGEHKIMDFIRQERSRPDYNPNTRHCLYGLDADLLMLGLCSHEPHFALLREEVVFGTRKTKSQKRTNVPDEITFHLLHLSLLREYLEYEFQSVKDKISFEYRMQNIIDDWILMCFLVGNDFIPNLPHMHIAHNALPILYKTYMETLPELNGYLNEAGTLNVERFAKFLKRLAEFDFEKFSDKHDDDRYLQSKRNANNSNNNNEYNNTDSKTCDSTADKDSNKGAKKVDPDIKRLREKFAHLDIPDSDSDDEDDDLLALEFIQHKRDYYMNKLDYENVTPEVLREQAHGYVRAVQWNLHYYYNGVQSWSWYYPHHYSPYISDIKDFSDIDLTFELGKPFLPFQQLLAILPSASKSLVPEAYQELMLSENSPIIDYYPREFSTDLNGKQQEWEAVVLIPFINENRLLEAMSKMDNKLTESERRRNVHSHHLLYTYSEKSLGTYTSKNNAFPDLTVNHALCTRIDPDFFRIPVSQIKKGLLDEVDTKTYRYGFPTLKHIEHKTELKNEQVKVFQMISRGDNMMLTVLREDNRDLDEIAEDLIGKIVYVDWPHLIEAKVTAVNDATHRFALEEHTGKIVKRNVNTGELEIFTQQAISIKERYYCRYGINVSKIHTVVHAKSLLGRKYICANKGLVTLEKQWAQYSQPYALQLVLKDIPAESIVDQQFKSVEDLFPVGATCFMLRHPNYGSMGEVKEVNVSDNVGRIAVKLKVVREPDLSRVIRNQDNLSTVHYMTAHTLSQQLGVSPQLASRMTGTVLIRLNSLEAAVESTQNVGLNLKFNRTCEEIPGYSKKTEDGWLYSNKTVALMGNYLQRFPEFFERLQPVIYADVISVQNLYPEEDDGSSKIKEIVTWLKEQEYYKLDRIKIGVEYLDEGVVKAIEDTVKKELQNETLKEVDLEVLPKYLFRPAIHIGHFPPDSTTTYHLFDRVINVREGIAVPLGLRGTVIGIHKGENERSTLYDVVFDSEFVGALELNCSAKKGFRLSSSSMINLSHGERTRPSKMSGTYQSAQNNVWNNKPSNGIYDNWRNHAQPPIQNKNQEHRAFGAGNKANPRNQAPLQKTRIFQDHRYADPSPRESLPNASYGTKRNNTFHHSPNSPFELQKPLSRGEGAENSDFAAVWKSLQNASGKSNEQPTKILSSPQQVNPQQQQQSHLSQHQTKEASSGGDQYGKRIPVEELFKGAEVNAIPNSQQNPVTELMHYVKDSMKGTASFKYNLIGNKWQVVITLSNGKVVFGNVKKEKEAAAESAARVALENLGVKRNLSSPQPLRRPFPVGEHAQLLMRPPLVPNMPGFALASPNIPRQPPPPSAAFIPDSFVRNNRETLENHLKKMQAPRFGVPVSYANMNQDLRMPLISSPPIVGRPPFFNQPMQNAARFPRAPAFSGCQVANGLLMQQNPPPFNRQLGREGYHHQAFNSGGYNDGIKQQRWPSRNQDLAGSKGQEKTDFSLQKNPFVPMQVTRKQAPAQNLSQDTTKTDSSRASRIPKDNTQSTIPGTEKCSVELKEVSKSDLKLTEPVKPCSTKEEPKKRLPNNANKKRKSRLAVKFD